MVTVLTGAISTVDTSPKYALGALTYYVDATYGAQVWRYVYNNSGSSIAANRGVMQEDGTDLYQVALSGSNCECARFLGVTQHAIAAASYGWVLASGVGLLASDGSTSVNTAQQCAASGLLTDGVVGTDELVAWAQATESPAGSGGTFQGIVRAL